MSKNRFSLEISDGTGAYPSRCGKGRKVPNLVPGTYSIKQSMASPLSLMSMSSAEHNFKKKGGFPINKYLGLWRNGSAFDSRTGNRKVVGSNPAGLIIFYLSIYLFRHFLTLPGREETFLFSAFFFGGLLAEK
jgi:hypothetical protein